MEHERRRRSGAIRRRELKFRGGTEEMLKGSLGGGTARANRAKAGGEGTKEKSRDEA